MKSIDEHLFRTDLVKKLIQCRERCKFCGGELVLCENRPFKSSLLIKREKLNAFNRYKQVHYDARDLTDIRFYIFNQKRYNLLFGTQVAVLVNSDMWTNYRIGNTFLQVSCKKCNMTSKVYRVR